MTTFVKGSIHEHIFRGNQANTDNPYLVYQTTPHQEQQRWKTRERRAAPSCQPVS